MKVVLRSNGELYPFGYPKVTKVELKGGLIQVWNDEFCLSTYSLQEFFNSLSLEVLEVVSE